MGVPAKAATPPIEWVKSLERSKAQIEAGESGPIEPVLDRLRESAARMDAGQAKRSAR